MKPNFLCRAILLFIACLDGSVTLAISSGARYPGGANLVQHSGNKSGTPEYPNLTRNGRATNTGVPMLDRIKQEAQMCKPDDVVVVRALQRSLNMVGGEIVQSATKGVGVHVQVVAYDKRTGAIIDNFGLTGDIYPIGKAGIEVERPEDILRKYDQKPLGEMEMSRACYEQASARTKKQLEASYYSALNNADLVKSIMLGAIVGGIDGYIKGGTLNSITEAGKKAVKSGINAATEQYDGKNFMVVSDNAKQMSFPGINCHVPYILLSKNVEGDHSLTIVQEYQLPGKSVSDVTSNHDTLHVPIDTSTRDGSDGESGRENVGKEATDDLRQENAVEEIRSNDDSQVGVRGWCTCPYRSAHITLGNLFRMGDDFKVADYSYMFCSDCYKCRKDLDDVTYLTKSGPICIWDVSIAVGNGLDGKRNPDEKTLKLLVEAQEKLMKIPDGEIVIPGLCRCASPAVWRFGRSPHKIEMCKSCGKPLSAIPLSAKNPRTPRKLRRCIKTPESPFVCTCAGETGLHPQLDASPYDEGEIQLSLMCKKCMQVKYSAFAPMREFKSKFANGKPDPQAVVEFLIGTTDLKAAMAAADKEVASQAGTGGSTRQ